MGRYDNNLKCAELRRLLEARNYTKAYQILETIDVGMVRNVTDLNAFAEVYRKAGKYEAAKEMLEIVYERTRSRMTLYKLANLAVLRKDFEEAEQLLAEYIEKCPEGEEPYVLRYRIEKAKGADYLTRIACLEKLRAYEYIEEWAYELATLYHKQAKVYHKEEKYALEAEMIGKCMEECSDIVLWFGEGVIVEKAKLLRMYHLEGSDALERYGVDLDRAKNKADEKTRLSRQDARMSTMELAEQIREFKEAERKSEIRKELAQELLPTMDIQQAMKRDLNIGETADVQEEISRMLEEQERRDKTKDTDMLIFEADGREFTRNIREALEAEAPSHGEKKKGFFWRKKKEETKEVKEEKEEGFWAGESSLEEELAAGVQKTQKNQDPSMEQEWEKHSETSADKEGAFEENVQDFPDAESMERNAWEGQSGECSGEALQDAEDAGETEINGWEKQGADCIEESTHGEESFWSGIDSVESMIVKKKENQDSSIIPVEEIKAALSGLSKEVKLSFESMPEEEEDDPGKKSVVMEEDKAPAKAEIKIHYGERYKEFAGDWAPLQEDTASVSGVDSAMMEGPELEDGLGSDTPAQVISEWAETKDAEEELTKESLQGEGGSSEEDDRPVRAGVDLEKNFSGFMQHYSIRKQIINVFTEMEQHEDWKKHFIIAGDPKTGKTTLARKLARVMNKIGAIKQAKYAKTTGSEINKMNLEEKKERLRGACLIIEQAGDMYLPTIRSLKKIMEDYEGNFVVILEDSQNAIERFLLENYDLQDYFHFMFRL